MRIVSRLLACLACALIAGLLFGPAAADPARLVVHLDQPGIAISPTFYGLMTEEINHSYDGGLYAELVRNRNLQDDPNQPSHWSLVQSAGATGTLSLDPSHPDN